MSRLRTSAAVVSLVFGGTLVGTGVPSASAATWTVTVGTDDLDSPAPGSLRHAVEAANAAPGQDRITIAPGLTITLADSLEVEDGTDIVGDAANPPSIVSPTGTALGVDVPTTADQVSLQHLTVDGTVLVYHAPLHVLIDDVTFRPGDGANQFQTGGTLTVRDSRFVGTADAFNSLADDCTDAAFSFTDTTFDGGASLNVTTACDVALTRVQVSDRDSGAVVAARDVTVLDSTFTDNRDRGLTLDGTRTDSVTGSTFADNQGGLARFGANGPLTIDRSTFRRNTVARDGGAVYLSLFEDDVTATVTDSLFEDNEAGRSGGAIYADGVDLSEPATVPSLTILRSTFAGNRATAGKSLTVSEVEGNVPGTTAPVVRIANSTFNEPEDPAVAPGPDGEAALADGAGSVIHGFEETEDRPILWLEHTTLVGGGITVQFTGENTSIRATNTVIDSGSFAALMLVDSTEDTAPTVEGQGNYATRPGPLAPVSTVAARTALALGPLADNGGLTPTRLPAADSVLIDAGVASAITDDQRRFARDARPDVGAVEIQVPTVSIQPLVEVTEGATARLQVTVSGRADHPGSVRVTSHDATATSGADYTPINTVVTWPAGATELTRTLEVPTLERAGAQGDRGLTVRLSGATGGRVTGAEGRVVIHDATSSSTPTPTTTPSTDPTDDPTSDAGTSGNGQSATPTATSTASSTGTLPDTGSPMGPLAVMAGLALVLAGALVTLFARRRRGTH